MTRAIQDKEVNKRLIEKSMRLQFMVDAMKERGDSEDVIHEVCCVYSLNLVLEAVFSFQINETLTPPEKDIVEKSKSRLKRLESSEVAIDEMLLLLQLFIYFQSPANK